MAATSSPIDTATDIKVDLTRNRVYFSDTNNHCIRMVDTVSGAIRTVAGFCKTSGYTGDGALAIDATLNLPSGIFFEGERSNLYIADSGNKAVRVVELSTGTITTVGGVGPRPSSVDRVMFSEASLDYPTGLFVDATNNILYISDVVTHKIRAVNAEMTTIAPSPTPTPISSLPANGLDFTNANITTLATGLQLPYYCAVGNDPFIYCTAYDAEVIYRIDRYNGGYAIIAGVRKYTYTLP
jgi:sugar lactone lactonase YvrE